MDQVLRATLTDSRVSREETNDGLMMVAHGMSGWPGVLTKLSRDDLEHLGA